MNGRASVYARAHAEVRCYYEFSIIFDYVLLRGPKVAPKPKNLGRHSDTDLIHTGHPQIKSGNMEVVSPNFLQYLWERNIR